MSTISSKLTGYGGLAAHGAIAGRAFAAAYLTGLGAMPAENISALAGAGVGSSAVPTGGRVAAYPGRRGLNISN